MTGMMQQEQQAAQSAAVSGDQTAQSDAALASATRRCAFYEEMGCCAPMVGRCKLTGLDRNPCRKRLVAALETKIRYTAFNFAFNFSLRQYSMVVGVGYRASTAVENAMGVKAGNGFYNLSFDRLG